MGKGKMVKRISICGVPKSGTKLLNHMIHTALPDWDYTPEERNFSKYMKEEKIITKKPLDLFRFQKAWEDADTMAIITCRDPLMVLTSKHKGTDYWVHGDRIGKGQPAPYKWYREIIKWQERGAFIVFYEELTKQPDLVQKQIEIYFNFRFKHPFSNYINMPIGKDYEYLNVVRPLETRKLRIEDLPHLGKELSKHPVILQQRKNLGYGNISVLQ